MSDFAHYTDEALEETLEALTFETLVRAALRPKPCVTFAALNATWWGERCHLAEGHDVDHDFGTPEEVQAKRESYEAADRDRQAAVLAEARRRQGVLS